MCFRLIDSGGDWDRRNRLKVYRALHLMSVRNFEEAAELLIDSLSTFTATELMEYEELVALAVLAGAVGCSRKDIKARVSDDSPSCNTHAKWTICGSSSTPISY